MKFYVNHSIGALWVKDYSVSVANCEQITESEYHNLYKAGYGVFNTPVGFTWLSKLYLSKVNQDYTHELATN